MSRFGKVMLVAAAAGGLALTTAGPAGSGASAAVTASQSIGRPSYNSAWAGYTAGGGRWFRYVCTTVTVPPSAAGDNSAVISLQGYGSLTPTQLYASQGGQVNWADPGGTGTFRVSPHAGDRVFLSIYYDQHGHDYLTVTDLTQHTTQTVRTNVPKMTYINARALRCPELSGQPIH
jgi:hypothetical protein